MFKIEFPENYKELFTPTKLETKSKSSDVYTKFHFWTLRKFYSPSDLQDTLFELESSDWSAYMPPGKTWNVSAVGICEEDAKKLKDLYIEWVRKGHRKSKKEAEKYHVWAHLDIGPKEYFAKDRSEEIKPGTIYIEPDRIWEDKREY